MLPQGSHFDGNIKIQAKYSNSRSTSSLCCTVHFLLHFSTHFPTLCCSCSYHHPHSLFHSSFTGSLKSTDQALLIHCSAKNLLTIWHVLSITAFCITIYRAGWRLSNFKLSCNLFDIILIVYNTSGIV